MASFSSYRDAAAALPADATWSSSFGYPGVGGYAEYHRDARGDRYIIQNGEFGDAWTMRPESPYGSNLPVFPCFRLIAERDEARAAIRAAREELTWIEHYLTSSKFHEDNTVQVRTDILPKIAAVRFSLCGQ